MFLLDANVLIEAKNRYYSFDIAPGFWQWLDHMLDQEAACSIDAVYEEILAGEDELADWAHDHKSFFREVDDRAAKHFAELSLWASSQRFTPAALTNFTGNNADYLLVAYAKGHDLSVVSHEQSNPSSRKRVLIPDACRAVGVKSIDTFEMLRRTEVRFDLRPGSGDSNVSRSNLF